MCPDRPWPKFNWLETPIWILCNVWVSNLNKYYEFFLMIARDLIRSLYVSSNLQFRCFFRMKWTMEQLYIDNLGSIFCPYNHEISILIIFRWSLASYTVLMLLSNGMKIVELYLAVNQHVKTFIFSNPFLSTAKVLIRALKLFARMRWIVNCKQQFEYQQSTSWNTQRFKKDFWWRKLRL